MLVLETMIIPFIDQATTYESTEKKKKQKKGTKALAYMLLP